MSDTITIVGTVGTDPEKKNPNGVPITTFRVATKDRRFDRATGAWIDGETNWYTASAYRRLAEHAFESLHKRDRVILTGRLRVRHWDTGEKRGTSVDIDVDAIGHDLLFGTTTFTPDEPAAAGSLSAPSDAWAPADSDQGWANPVGAPEASHALEPGGSADGQSSAVIDEADRRMPALAGAETPF